MENKQLISFVVVLVVGVGLGYGFASKTSYQFQRMGSHRMPNGEMMANGSMMNDSMGSMMAGLNGKTEDAFDRAFLAEMIVHHEGAVEMAQAALKNAKHQELKNMANAIISAQTTEIEQMRNWQKAWYNQ